MQKKILFSLGLITLFQNSNSVDTSTLIKTTARAMYTSMNLRTLSRTAISNSPTITHSEYRHLHTQYELLVGEIVNMPTTKIELKKQIQHLDRLIAITKRMISILHATPHNFYALKRFELETQLKSFITMRSWLSTGYIN